MTPSVNNSAPTDLDLVDKHLEKLSTELSQCYEQIMLLYNLSTHMNLDQSNATYLQLACDQLTQLVPVEGIAIFLEKKMDSMKRLVLSAGSGLIALDPIMADILQMHLTAELTAGKEALLDSQVDNPFKFAWPERIRNILAVPVGPADKMMGFLVATNILNKPDFDSTDVKLFNSVANQCAVFIENGRLFNDLKELFIGSLKALTNSIDAKDQYTRGHSERVALISRWIAEYVKETHPLSEKEIHYIYLAGLLHDIGKIGVSESVLRKQGKLSEEERAIILAHPRIGASILSEIPQMREIIPGVLHHHERYDGQGYPEGLSGQDIPFSARIIALADAFDAMTSRRVYRDAMSIRRALTEVEKGLGTQFDPVVTRAFLDSPVDQLWKVIQDGFIETWNYSNFEEYGTKAVGALIR
jgi:HD-GYP domain-containing protein (c-di-GMP phosphodiesterase class II)